MKYLYLTLSSEDDPERSYVLEGDRRQTNSRMIERALEKITREPVTTIEPDTTYKTEESRQTFTVEEARLLEEPEAEELKRNHMTLVINENVTENACRVRYSHGRKER